MTFTSVAFSGRFVLINVMEVKPACLLYFLMLKQSKTTSLFLFQKFPHIIFSKVCRVTGKVNGGETKEINSLMDEID